jgi:hypothetical protein
MLMCCLFRAVAHLRNGNRFESRNGGMMIIRGKQKKLEETPASLPLHPP